MRVERLRTHCSFKTQLNSIHCYHNELFSEQKGNSRNFPSPHSLYRQMLWISPWIGDLTIMNSMKLILPHCTWHVFGFPGIPSEKTEPRRFTINFFLMSSHAWFLEIPLRCRQHKSCKCCYVLMICFENLCYKIPNKNMWEFFLLKLCKN